MSNYSSMEHTSKSKSEIQFQYGGCPFSKTGSSFISAVDWDISSKFGVHIDFHLLKQKLSLNLNPEVHFRLYAAILKIRRDVITPPLIVWLLRNLARKCKMTYASKSKPEIEFQYGDHQFSETGNTFMISAVVWDIPSKFGMELDFPVFKQMPSLNLKPGVDFRLYGRHLENSIWRHNSAADRPISTKFKRQM